MGGDDSAAHSDDSYLCAYKLSHVVMGSPSNPILSELMIATAEIPCRALYHNVRDRHSPVGIGRQRRRQMKIK